MGKQKQYSGRPKGLSKKYKDLIHTGAEFGNWKVISEEVIPHPTSKKNTIQCMCSCGMIKNIDVYTLGNGNSTGCYNCGHKGGQNHPNYKGYKEIPLRWFSRYSRRNREFNIEIKYVYDLWVKQDKKCALSGIPISFKNTAGEGFYRCNASLDRISSSKGYIIGNIQLMHKNINRMKSDFDEDYFIEMCKLISQNK